MRGESTWQRPLPAGRKGLHVALNPHVSPPPRPESRAFTCRRELLRASGGVTQKPAAREPTPASSPGSCPPWRSSSHSIDTSARRSAAGKGPRLPFRRIPASVLCRRALVSACRWHATSWRPALAPPARRGGASHAVALENNVIDSGRRGKPLNMGERRRSRESQPVISRS
ncbi:unnamed protein product [Caretta caretta]